MNTLRPSIKKRLQQGEFIIGTWCLLPSESVINVIAKTGMDFVLIDLEHGPIDFTCASRMVMAAEAEGCEAIIRVSANNESEILKALDVGASGVIVPHIETINDREKAISFIKYPPQGVRGFSPYARAGGYTSRKNHTTLENERTLSGIITEGLNSIKNIDKIIDAKELDVVYIGTYDLSVAIGIPGEVKNPKIIEVLKECAVKIRAKGKAVGDYFIHLTN
jgi:4-hydroxy-2-oxoheptanedioate aldolase